VNTGISNELTATDNIYHHTTEKPLDINEKPNESQTTCTNSFLPENMDTLKEDSIIFSSYLPTTEKTPNTKETPNQDNDNHAKHKLYKHTRNTRSPSHQKNTSAESTCTSSPVSPISSTFNMEIPDIPQVKTKLLEKKKQNPI
jgi:hypothetical protein